MKAKLALDHQSSAIDVFATVLCLLTSAVCLPALAQTTAFTYQGRLNDGVNPANGSYDLRFALFDSLALGNQVGVTLTNSPVIVSNGLFTVTLDFGNQFPGSDRWLEIGVRTNGGGLFATLNPRQKLTPTPYAITAATVTGVVPSGSVAGNYSNAVNFGNTANTYTGSYTGNGGGLTNVNAATLDGLGANQFWRTGGNSNTVAGANFLGTTDNQALELSVNGQRALRLEPETNGAPNLIGGASINFVDAGVIGATIAGGGAVNYSGFLAGPSSNHISAIFGTIGGGRINSVNADHSTIAGGLANTIEAFAYDSVISGGYGNLIRSNAQRAVIGGGDNNRVEMNAAGAGIGGGTGNTIQESASGGRIDGGYGNQIGTNAFNAKIGGGTINSIDYASREAVIGGGLGNVIGNGADFSMIGGGFGNWIQNLSQFATLGGGRWNVIGTNSAQSFIGGGQGNAIELNSTNCIIGGGFNNAIQSSAYLSTIAGGRINRILTNAHDSAISGGVGNVIGTTAYGATIGGGNSNTVASGAFATIAGGDQNVVGDASILGGAFAAVGGGSENLAMGQCSAVPGGRRNSALGFCSFAGGYRAKALDSGSFVWADTVDADFGYPGDNKFQVRATGGVLFYANGPATIGVYLAPGGNSWAPTSDRNAKENFRKIDSQEILAKVAALPVLNYNLKSQDKSIRHLGPMAQDFAAAFHLGEDDKHITTIDADGVALAAIQGLNEKLTEELKRRDAENVELRQELSEIKHLLTKLSAKNN